MQRFLAPLLGLLAILLSFAGCESKIPKQDLGKVVFEVPQVPGSEKPFPMPELDPAPNAKGPAPGGAR